MNKVTSGAVVVRGTSDSGTEPRMGSVGADLTHPNSTLAVLCGATFMVLLDNSIVNVALPSIQQDLGFTSANVQWVLTGYALPFGGFLLIGGRLGDLFGARRVFLSGLVLFAGASLAGAFAVAPWMLVGARMVQGLGAAALSPSAMALVIGLFRGQSRNRALGVYAATATLGLTVGMVLGGVLTGLGGWRWVMFVNVPIALATLLPARSVIPPQRGMPARSPVNLTGAAAITLGLAGLLYTLQRVADSGSADPVALAVLTTSAVLLGAFWMIQLRAPAPLLPPAVLRDGAIRTTATVMLLKSTMGIAALYLPTLYFQEVLGYSVLASGLAFVPAGVASTLAGLSGPWLLDRMGSPRAMLMLSLTVQTTGLLGMSIMPANRSPIPMIVGVSLAFVGLLWADGALNVVLSLAVTDDNRGTGTGVIRTAAQLGGALGLGVIATLVTARAPDAFTATVADQVLGGGLRVGLWCSAVFAAAGAAVALVGLRGATTTNERTR
jgi:EmrB/QacA subfamily drug resistance transporter